MHGTTVRWPPKFFKKFPKLISGVCLGLPNFVSIEAPVFEKVTKNGFCTKIFIPSSVTSVVVLFLMAMFSPVERP